MRAPAAPSVSTGRRCGAQFLAMLCGEDSWQDVDLVSFRAITNEETARRFC